MTAERPELSDEVVDTVAVRWAGDADPFLARLEAPHAEGIARRVLENFALVPRWDDVRFLAEGVAAAQSRVTDLGGFSYPATTELAGRVVLVDGGDHAVIVSRAAFTRLFSRLLDVLIEGAANDGEPATTEPWWPSLVHNAGRVREEATRR